MRGDPVETAPWRDLLPYCFTRLAGVVEAVRMAYERQDVVALHRRNTQRGRCQPQTTPKGKKKS